MCISRDNIQFKDYLCIFIPHCSRCYNCGDFGNHIAAKCPHGPLPKRCHNCKSTEHLIADCPIRTPEKPLVRNGNNGNIGLGDGHSSGIGGL